MSEDATKAVTEEAHIGPKEANIAQMISSGGLINVPTAEVDIFTDAKASMRLAELIEEQKLINKVKPKDFGTLVGGGELEYPEEYYELQKHIDALMDKLEDSKLVFKLRGILPATRRAISDMATQATTKHFEGQATVSKEERQVYHTEWFAVEMLRKQLECIELPAQNSVQKEISHDDLEMLLNHLYDDDRTRLHNASYDIATAAANAAMHDDAGFRSRKSSRTAE